MTCAHLENKVEDSHPTSAALVVSDDAAAAKEKLNAVLGTDAAVVVVDEASLRSAWPDYVVARAKTSGAFVAAGVDEPASYLRLADGKLLGRDAKAGVAGGFLVFLVGEPGAEHEVETLRKVA